jgi:hypothetical protein
MNLFTRRQGGDEVKSERALPPLASGASDLRAIAGASPTLPIRVLFLDDDPRRAERFLKQVPAAVWVKSVAECLPRMSEDWDEIHLDHDLEGEILVDTNRVDSGMEIIRWLCKEPRSHLKKTRFFVHTHNFAAGLLMVLQMHESGYRAEFRPFGNDLAAILQDGEDEAPEPMAARPGLWRRWQQWVARVAEIRWRKRKRPS